MGARGTAVLRVTGPGRSVYQAAAVAGAGGSGGARGAVGLRGTGVRTSIPYSSAVTGGGCLGRGRETLLGAFWAWGGLPPRACKEPLDPGAFDLRVKIRVPAQPQAGMRLENKTTSRRTT